MELLEDKNRNLGLIGTVIFHALLLLFFIYYGLTTPVPIPKQTIVINFGTSDQGQGNVQPEEANAAPMAQNKVQEVVKQIDPTPVKTNTEAVTQDNTDAVSLNNKKTETKKVEPEPIKEPEKTVNKSALYTGKSNTSKSSSSEGETGKAGDQGDPGGDKSSLNHTGSYSGGGDRYDLGIRKALVKTKPRYDCQESGKVAVTIKVDKKGNVVSAQAGGRGTTNSAECLIKTAEEAAFKTKWQADENAPELQTGVIVYNFVLN
ncbi:MAG: energy transducer TonB [Bacteroidetes bacterium]|nr:energy transducer TonB [Bacteroidota bacterium]HET6245992.1 energy transducer TonB [Bacteroidia bacterium]